jgi:3-hydroxyisobutyrate dehydrogenase-like beta-hydroxyacid dehydrogenase
MNGNSKNLARKLKENIGLVGIGLVGSALAENLLKSGFNVVGHDIDEERRKYLSSIGGTVVSSANEVANKSNRIILALMTSEIVEEVIEGNNGILSSKNRPKYIIDTTTGNPDKTIGIGKKLESEGVHYIDATIAGSSEQIKNKLGVFMIGGKQHAYESCLNIFTAISSKHIYLGASGSGARAKLAVNLVLGLNRAVLAEGLVFAERMGMDLTKTLELFSITPAYSRAIDVKGQKMIDENFAPQARLSQHKKDVNLILEAAKSLGQELPLSKMHYKLLSDATSRGDGDLDNCAIIREIRRLKMN